MSLRRFSAAAVLSLAFALFTTGCEVDSANTFIRDVPVDFSGFYEACEGNAIVQANSGNRIRTLDLRQNGDQLEAFDNNGAIWRGSLGEVQNGRSSFTLEGRTSTGVEGIFSGTLSSSGGGSTTSVSAASGNMTGTYIEPDRFSTFCGNASIPGSIDTGGGGGGGGGSGGTFGITASDNQLGSGDNAILQVNGGTGPFNWLISSGGGQLLSAQTDDRDNVFYRGTSTNGPATVRVTDSSGQTATVTIEFI